MKSGLVQLIVKNVLAGRQVQPLPSQQRYKPVDSFKKYIYEILPPIQESIQINILKKTLDKIPNAQVRKELINAYIHRLFKLKIYEKDQLKAYKEVDGGLNIRTDKIVDPTIEKQINQHTSYDIGSYIQFQPGTMQKHFKIGCFGELDKRQYDLDKKFGLMVREQSVSIVEGMRQLGTYQKIKWSQIGSIPNQDLNEYINDEKIYPQLFTDVSNRIYEKVQKYRGDEQYLRVWGSSVISDTLTNSIIQNISNLSQISEKSIDQYINQAVQWVMALEVKPSPGDFWKRFKTIPLKPQLPVVHSLVFNSKFYWQTPSMKSVFLGGGNGKGKSMILAYATMWAHKNNWLVISLPSARLWTHDTTVRGAHRAYNGLFLLNKQVAAWLDHFATSNGQELLKSIKIDLSKYGKHDITGVHENDYQPVPNLWDERRQVYFNEVTQKLEDRRDETQIYKEKNFRMTDVCPQPKNLLDIIQAGIKNQFYATCAMGQVLSQVYDSDLPILEAVDAFSFFYEPSDYPSFRYYNDRGLYGRVPPYHIAHCRMLMHLDGHKIKRGLKIVASSTAPFYRRQFDIKKMMLPQKYEHNVRDLTPEEFNSAARYNILVGWWNFDAHQKYYYDYAYMVSQGNWGDFNNYMKFGTYY